MYFKMSCVYCCSCGYCCSCPVCIVVILCVFVVLYNVCIAVFTLDAGLLARSQYSEGPATGHLDTRFSWFPCVYKQTLRWSPSFQVATKCFSFSPPNLNLVVNKFIFCLHLKLTPPPVDNPIAVNKYYYYYYYYYYYSNVSSDCISASSGSISL